MTVEAWNNRALWESQASEMNSLTPNGDWRLISPYRITLASNIKVMRIRKMITNLFYIFLMAKQILLDSSMGKGNEVSAEKIYFQGGRGYASNIKYPDVYYRT